jgi:hypothetical protein
VASYRESPATRPSHTSPGLSGPRTPEGGCDLNTPDLDFEVERTGRDSAARSINPEGSTSPRAEKRRPGARTMRIYVYYRHQGSGKDVIPHQAHRE